MKLAKCLLVALALWMPAVSFAAALGSARTEQTPCEESAPEAASDARSEDNEMHLTPFIVTPAGSRSHTVELAGHRPLDGHIAELLIPPPNPASLR
ncbi:MAG: hypothetical protein ABL955_04670 [Elusimicrobiota bacterium]